MKILHAFVETSSEGIKIYILQPRSQYHWNAVKNYFFLVTAIGHCKSRFSCGRQINSFLYSYDFVFTFAMKQAIANGHRIS